MSKVWRFTGNPENWITALSIEKWALNDEGNNPSTWRRIEPDDTVVFHSTRNSGYTNKAISSIIGFAFVGESKYMKEDLWWIQEQNSNENIWPNVIEFEDIYVFSDINDIELDKALINKSDEQIKNEKEINEKEVELIRKFKSNDPQIGYNQWPKIRD